MIAALTCCLLSWPASLPSPLLDQATPAAQDPALEAKLAAAGKDVAKLLELASSYVTAAQEDAAKKVFKKVLELDPNNEAAHKGLRHQLYDKKWFESFAELSKYKREEAAKMKAKGLARFKDEWVPEAELPFLNMGWTKDEKGAFQNPHRLARAKQVAEWTAAGYEFRADDNSWIAPDDSEKWARQALEVRRRVGRHGQGQRVPRQDRARLGARRRALRGRDDHATGRAATPRAGTPTRSGPSCVRIFGVEPPEKPHVIVLNSLEQYNLVAGNTPLLPEFEGYSSLHGAYFADLYFDDEAKPPQFLGCGVSYWVRKDPKGEIWGPLWLRWAAAQSFVDAIDPSWGAIGDRIAGAGTVDQAAFATAFWCEKKIPRWLRYGAASYVERFQKDPRPPRAPIPGRCAPSPSARSRSRAGCASSTTCSPSRSTSRTSPTRAGSTTRPGWSWPTCSTARRTTRSWRRSTRRSRRRSRRARRRTSRRLRRRCRRRS